MRIKPRARGLRYVMNLLLVTIGSLLALLLIVVALEVQAMTNPAPSAVCCTTPGDLGLRYEAITFTTHDQLTLAGWYIPPRNGATIILLHGYGGNRMGMLNHAQILAERGYGVLLYDLRAHGESQGALRSWGWLDVGDVTSAVAYLRTRSEVDPRRIGAMGVSIGGQIALRAAAETTALKAVAADGASPVVMQDVPLPVEPYERLLYVTTWLSDRGLELRTRRFAPPGIARVIGGIAPRPVLLISTGQTAEQMAVRHYYAQAQQPKTLWEIPEAEHGGGLAMRPRDYAATMLTFFDQALLDADRPGS